MDNNKIIIDDGKEVLNLAATHLQRASRQINTSFAKAVEMLAKNRDNIVVSGIGKSGIVAQKVAATLSSTGAFAHFVHPSEAFHGDFGRLKAEDVLILFSHSGETEELVKFLKKAKELHSKTQSILITSNMKSSLALLSDAVIQTYVEIEHHDEAFAHIPTTSSTVSIAIGDALAVALQKQKNFQAEQFLRLHPGGDIGKLHRSEHTEQNVR